MTAALAADVGRRTSRARIRSVTQPLASPTTSLIVVLGLADDELDGLQRLRTALPTTEALSRRRGRRTIAHCWRLHSRYCVYWNY